MLQILIYNARMSLESFISQNFGAKFVKRLKAIRTGGDNNAKGHTYERYFTAFKIIEAWSNTKNEPASRKDIQFTIQEKGFVDDLTIRDHRQPLKFKTNYQAKNSSGIPASYNDSVHERFVLQEKIDQIFWGYQNTKQVLLVPCLQKANNNQKVINQKKVKANNFTSEFFPYEPNHLSLLNRNVELKQCLKGICTKEDLSSLDNGFRLVLSAMEGCQTFELSTVIEKAKKISNPDIFHDSEDKDVPNWLVQLCSSWGDITFSVKSCVIFVQFNGLEIRLSDRISEPSPVEMMEVKTKNDLITLLMGLASQEFKAEKARRE